MPPLVIGLMTVVGPVVLGTTAGRWLRVLTAQSSWRHVIPAFAMLVALSPFVVGHLIPISIYDCLLMSVCCAVSFCTAGWRRAPIPVAGVVIATVILVGGLAGAELLARRMAGVAGHARPPGELHIVFQNTDMDFSCDAMWSADHVGPQPPPDRRRILYIGDSMVASLDVLPSQRFMTLIQAARPDEDHHELSSVGIGLDMYYYLVRQALPKFGADEVLLFVFLGNDFFDLDVRHDCCRGRILDYRGGNAVLRCLSADASISLRQKFRMSPAPYLLRVLAWDSVLADTVATDFERVAQSNTGWAYTDWVPTAEQYEHGIAAIRAIRDELARQRVAFKLILLPPRWTLERHEPSDPFRALHEHVLDETRAAGIRTFDTWEVFQDAIDRDHTSDWFQGEAGNPHFGIAGHRLLARWLLENVIGVTGG